MKRKLISFDAFQKMQQESLSNAIDELVEAEHLLATALGIDSVSVHSYGPESVIYETSDKTYIHANYSLNNGHIVLENIEQLVVDEDTERKHARELLSNLVDSVLEDKTEKANQIFSEYISLTCNKRSFNETMKMRVVPRYETKDGKKKLKGYEKARWQDTPHSSENSSNTIKRVRNKKIKGKKLSQSAKKFRAMRREKISKQIGECFDVCRDVLSYVDYKKNGPALKESTVQHDERGNVVAISLPTTKVKNEAKLQQFDWKVLNTDVKVLRGKAKSLREDIDFCKAMSELRHHNAMSDNDALETTLENIVTKWPQVLYLTQTELAEAIAYALEFQNDTNYDDQTCDFMAEGILRVAHNSYGDRVGRIWRLSGVQQVEEQDTDNYSQFQKAVEEFYPSLDENYRLEMQVFIDLYESIRAIHEAARQEDERDLVAEAAAHLNELLAVVQEKVEPTLEVAESAAEWLADLVETNLESQDWSPSNSVHITTTGDHPDMSKKASHSYAPSKDASGNWGAEMPVSDGKNYRGGSGAEEMKHNTHGNVGGNDAYPSLQNPYVPAAKVPEIKGEKNIEADDSSGQYSSSDTWPSLQNPYVPQGVTPYNHKINKGNEPDAVVDK